MPAGISLLPFLLVSGKDELQPVRLFFFSSFPRHPESTRQKERKIGGRKVCLLPPFPPPSPCAAEERKKSIPKSAVAPSPPLSLFFSFPPPPSADTIMGRKEGKKKQDGINSKLCVLLPFFHPFFHPCHNSGYAPIFFFPFPPPLFFLKLAEEV